MSTTVEKFMHGDDNAVNQFLNWQAWEMITHLAVFVLFVYVIYLLFTSLRERTVTNWLLLLIALAIGVQIHQNINLQKKLQT